MGVVSKQRELLVLGKWVITSTKEVFGDLTVTEWLLESSGWRISLDSCNLSLSNRSILRALGAVHLVHHHLLLVLLLLGVVLLLLAS